MDELFDFIVCRFDLTPIFQMGTMTIRATADRIEKVVTIIRAILDSSSLPPALCAMLRGKLFS